MDACYCDYEPAEWSRISTPKARKQYRCYECGAFIAPSDRHEYVAGKWEGEVSSYRTCSDCVSLRQYIQAHIPCFCWAYGNLFSDALDALREYVHEVPGMAMESGRLIVALQRRNREARRLTTHPAAP